MASFRLEWRRSAAKELRRLPASEVSRIVDAANELTHNPRPAGCVKLSGSACSLHLRGGDSRHLSDIYDDRLVIEVIKVGHRKDVYRD